MREMEDEQFEKELNEAIASSQKYVNIAVAMVDLMKTFDEHAFWATICTALNRYKGMYHMSTKEMLDKLNLSFALYDALHDLLQSEESDLKDTDWGED